MVFSVHSNSKTAAEALMGPSPLLEGMPKGGLKGELKGGLKGGKGGGLWRPLKGL